MPMYAYVCVYACVCVYSYVCVCVRVRVRVRVRAQVYSYIVYSYVYTYVCVCVVCILLCVCVVCILYALNKLQGMETLCPTQVKHAIELKQVIALTKPLVLTPLIRNCSTNLQSSQTCIRSTSSGRTACVLSTGRQRAK
jgi:hypothetical protein